MKDIDNVVSNIRGNALAIMSRYIGCQRNQQTIDDIGIQISKLFEEQFKDLDLQSVKIETPEYNDDKDIRNTQCYEEYCIRKDMKNEKKLDLTEYEIQRNLSKGQITTNISFKLPHSYEVTRFVTTLALT